MPMALKTILYNHGGRKLETLTLLKNYIPLIKLQTYTNKLKTYTWNVLPHPQNCPFVQFIDMYKLAFYWQVTLTGDRGLNCLVDRVFCGLYFHVHDIGLQCTIQLSAYTHEKAVHTRI